MQKYKFNEHANQAIVNGILQGYKNYLEERSEKEENMKISTAYAWVRGNHIDDQTAALCEEVGIEYLQAKAGYSWGYLQFVSDQDRKMFIVKNGRYLNKDNITSRKHTGSTTKADENHYLYKLSQLNQNVDFPRNFQLELPMDEEVVVFNDEHNLFTVVDNEMETLKSAYDYFYIISYELDQYGMISRIQLLLPSPVDGKAHLVDNLTGYIESSTVDFTDIDTSFGTQDQELQQTEYPETIEYDITTYDDLIEKTDDQ